MNKYKIYAGSLILAFGLCAAMPVGAQNKKNKKKPKTAKAALIINIETTIVDENNNPIRHAEIIAGEGAISHFSDKAGKVSIQTKANGVLLVEALGYEDAIIDLSKQQFPKVLKLKKTEMLASGKYKINRPDGGTTNQKDLVGAISSVTGEELTTYPDFSLSNTLQGRIPGLVVRSNSGAFALNSSSLFVRGLHGKDNNQAIVIVDGIERSMEDIIPEEIATIEVLKDATAKILYGARAANGVLVVTTRRGEANKRVIRASVEAGVMMTTRTPEYLDSYNYASLYNEARRNDGLPNFYTDSQLNGYKNSTGPNDLLYPNVDYYDYFLQKQSMYRRAMIDLNGGSNKVKYSMIANYVGGNGFEKIGDRPDLNRLNVRGNLDIQVTDYLSVIADAAARLEMKNWSSVGNGDVFTALSSTRPNEYPLTISPDDLGMAPDEKGIPYFGSSLRHPANLFADMQYGGFMSERYVTSQTNIGLDFTLDKFVKGLSASAFITFDNYNYFKQGQSNVYPTYAIRGIVNGTPEFLQMKKLSLQDDQSRLGEETRRTLGWRANVGYTNRFGKHDVTAILAYNYYQNETKGGGQDIKNANTTLRMNYVYDNRYAVEGDLALMGSNRFENGNRYFLSGAIGAGWILSNEGFLADYESINYLKLKASFGVLGYDRATDFLLYNTAWQNGDNLAFGEQNKTTVHTTQFVRFGNKDLKWERSTEWNIGIEGFFFQNRLKAELNYFNEVRDQIIGSKSAMQMDILGPFVSFANMGKVRNNGIDAYVQWNDRNGDLYYQVGANLTWSKNKLLKWNEVDFPDKYTKAVGKPTDAMFGYQSQGLFGKDVPLQGSNQLLGSYQEGDIAYADLNDDGYIDGRDKKMLGNSHPRMALGIDVNLQYKNWGLYILGTAEFGLDAFKNNSYYWNKGEEKYSKVVLDRYHSENNPNGAYPRLTTTQGDNNFVNSSFWIENASFFRLKNVELSYTFTNKKENSLVKKVKLFGRGTNLFVLSKEKDLDPEMMNAGVTNYPVYTTLTGGLTVTF